MKYNLKLPNTVINFHTVNSKIEFRNTISQIVSNYNVISIQKLHYYLANGIIPDNICHITFDDGHKSFYEFAFPILKEYNIPASLYVSPLIISTETNYWFQTLNFIDPLVLKSSILLNTGINVGAQISDMKIILKNQKISTIKKIINQCYDTLLLKEHKYQNITMKQLKEISNSGIIEIGAHTMNHPILRNEDYYTAKFEICESIEMLSQLLGKKIDYFAYPNGIYGQDFSEREINILRSSGIKLAFSTNQGLLFSDSNTYSLPRSGSPLYMENKQLRPLSHLLKYYLLLFGQNAYYKLMNTWHGINKH